MEGEGPRNSKLEKEQELSMEEICLRWAYIEGGAYTEREVFLRRTLFIKFYLDTSGHSVISEENDTVKVYSTKTILRPIWSLKGKKRGNLNN